MGGGEDVVAVDERPAARVVDLARPGRVESQECHEGQLSQRRILALECYVQGSVLTVTLITLTLCLWWKFFTFRCVYCLPYNKSDWIQLHPIYNDSYGDSQRVSL